MKSKTLFYIPRIITIIFILFISIFALDVFGNGTSFLETAIALFMHLLPTIILTSILVFAWRKSKVLAGMWILFGIWYLVMTIPRMLERFEFYYLSWFAIFTGSSWVIAYLFLLDAKKNKLKK
jgi:hypothetical protein